MKQRKIEKKMTLAHLNPNERKTSDGLKNPMEDWGLAYQISGHVMKLASE
jgi:hypothetical protein